jgi:hypothetical protein
MYKDFMFLRAVLLPFLWTRLLLAGVAWFGLQMSVSWTYPFPEAARRGWAFVPTTWIDAFGRWDAHWYLDVASRGYELRGPLASVQSNVAFFPLYPWTVRVLHAVLPGHGDGSWYLAALAVSNAALVAALWLLWRVARDLADEEAATRTLLYVLLFPAGFVLSAPYPEALFLLLSVASLAAALKGRPGLAGLLGLLLALTRPGGVLVAVPLAWIALERGGRRLAALAAAALPGVGLAVHAALLWRVTGDPLALFHAQGAWGRVLTAPWRTLLHPRDFHPWLGPLEAVALALVAGLGAWLLRRKETRALGIWALASLLPVLLSGTLLSSVRFAAVIFPAFLALGILGRRAAFDRVVVIGFSFAQAILFLFWARFFWVG